ncbi:hydrogenase maturation protease [Streptomyces sp. 891-h]|uniref:hydrogenase maturation protease n=1 Tax=Streptomyces sp. 891-h TaxID=2720714 RepID=UPI001FA9D4E4|nr:hydrogenase maturation protease [Streptomyces sp. 891-h]
MTPRISAGIFARTTVVGVGNVHRRDDGVGPAVIARLARHTEEGTLPASVRLRVSDGEPARLLDLWEGADSVIVVDAVRTPRPVPGRVHRLEADDVVLQPEAGAGSASSPSSHGLGLGAALRLARTLGRLPRHLVVYGVEAADTSLGTGLTPRAAEAVGPLADRIVQEIRGLRLRARPVPDAAYANPSPDRSAPLAAAPTLCSPGNGRLAHRGPRATARHRRHLEAGTMHSDRPRPGAPDANSGRPGDDTIATRCAVRREQLGLSRDEVARRAGMSVAYLNHLETLSDDFDPAALMRLAAVLEMPYDELREGPREPEPGQQAAAARPMLARLSEDECWQRLGTHGIGRVGLSAGPAPVILPVNFLVDGRTIVYRTETGGPAAAAEGDHVAFEADHMDEHHSRGWSVLITGTARHLTDRGAVALLADRPGAEPWAGGRRELWIRVHPEQVTGRTIHTR